MGLPDSTLSQTPIEIPHACTNQACTNQVRCAADPLAQLAVMQSFRGGSLQLFESTEFDTQPLPQRADGNDFARVKCAQFRYAALQIYKRSCCDAAFQRGQST